MKNIMCMFLRKQTGKACYVHLHPYVNRRCLKPTVEWLVTGWFIRFKKMLNSSVRKHIHEVKFFRVKTYT